MKSATMTICKTDVKSLNKKKQAKLTWGRAEKIIRERDLKVVLIMEGESCKTSKDFIKKIQDWSSDPNNIKKVNLKKTISETAPTYFQPLISYLPSEGQITIFENCWYEKSIQKSELGRWNITLWNEFSQKEEILKEAGYIIIKYAFNTPNKKGNSSNPIFEVLNKTKNNASPFIYFNCKGKKEEPFKLIQYFSKNF